MIRLMKLLLCALLVAGCSNENIERHITLPEKANDMYTLPKKMKIVNVTDKYNHELSVLMRPMRKDERAETYKWHCLRCCYSITIKEVD